MKELRENWQNKDKINLGCGRNRRDNFCNIDIQSFVDGNDEQMVDILLDLEEENLPFGDNEINFIRAYNVFEHLGDGFIHCLNECHRVLKEDGLLRGVVPVAGTEKDFRDPTHKRHFIRETFGYLTGKGKARPDRPSHPRYADYGILPWREEKINQEEDLIHFELRPRKVDA